MTSAGTRRVLIHLVDRRRNAWNKERLHGINQDRKLRLRRRTGRISPVTIDTDKSVSAVRLPSQSHVFPELGQWGFCIMMYSQDTSTHPTATVLSPH
jgi:hypothetical protein